MSFTGKLGNSGSLLGDIILGSPDTGGGTLVPTYGLIGASGSVLELMVLGRFSGSSGILAISISAADTGSGLDAGSTTVSVTGSDRGSGLDIEAPSGAAFYIVNELGVAVDTLAVSASISASDSGSGSEAFGNLGVLIGETGIGSDVESSTAPFSTSDSGTGTDFETAGPYVTDTGQGVDAASFTDTTPPCDATSGTLEARANRLGPEYFLPHWTTPNSLRTGISFQVCQWLAETEIPFRSQAIRASIGRYLSTASVLEPIYEWTAQYTPPDDRELIVTFQANTTSGQVADVARRAVSRFDFETAVDPVWYSSSSDRTLRLRNLFMRQIQRYTSGSVYTICGRDAYAYLGVVPDTGYFYRRSPVNSWEWISPDSLRFAPTSVTLPGSGTWQIAFGSSAFLASIQSAGTVTISWLGGQTRAIPLTFNPVKNLFDAYGDLLGIPRLISPPIYESNFDYKSRMLALVEAPPDTTIPGVIRGIGGRFNLLRKVGWNGVSSLVLDASNGAAHVTSALVVGVDKFLELTETLLPTSGNTRYYSVYNNWREGALVLVNGIPVNTFSQSGNVLIFSTPVTGTVQVIYSVASYTVSTTADGFITTLNPGQAIPSGHYTVLYTNMVNAHTVDQPDYQTQSLLQPDGLPNSLFLEIAAKLTENNPTTFGRARWGSTATWFEQTEDKPKISRLPIPLDNNTSNG